MEALVRNERAAADALYARYASRIHGLGLVLAYLGQLTSTQVAELQGIPPGTVKSRIRAGGATLRRTLGEGELGPAAHPHARSGRSHPVMWRRDS
jgi:hypothetical protein